MGKVRLDDLTNEDPSDEEYNSAEGKVRLDDLINKDFF